jgi:hypothetical protein
MRAPLGFKRLFQVQRPALRVGKAEDLAAIGIAVVIGIAQALLHIGAGDQASHVQVPPNLPLY